MEKLAGVAQVGKPALAVDLGQYALGKTFDQSDRLGEGCHPLHAQHSRPVVESSVDLLPRVLAGSRNLLGGPAEEARERSRVRAGSRGWAFQRLEESEPFAGWFGGEDAAGAVDDSWDAGLVEGFADEG